MQGVSLLLFIGAVIAAIFAFSGAFNGYSVYSEPVTVAPYDFAAFLFWMFLLLFFGALIFGSVSRPRRPRRPLPPTTASTQANIQSREMEARKEEDSAAGGFMLALFFFIIAIISGLFGFGAIASTMAGIAMIVFWIAVILAIVAVGMGFFSDSGRTRYR